MMSLPKTISTIELQSLTGLSKSGVTKFEQQGVIKRSAVNEWPMPDTLVALVTHVRERKPVVSTERQNFERARAQREQMKAEQMAGQLCRVSDFSEAIDDVFGFLIPRLDALPSRVTRDLDLRRQWNEEIRMLRTEVSAYCKKRAAELGGEAA
jgi:phage terminase Nu1 subunit (DNA packaging protein)